MELTRRKLIYLIACLMDFAYFMFIFTVTRKFSQDGATLLNLGFTGGAISCAYAISGVIVGHLSDRWGRRRTIVLGIATLIVAYALCCLWPKQLMLYLTAAMAGLAAGIVNPPLIAWLAEGSHRPGQAQIATRTLFRFCLSWNVGVIFGQTGGGWLFTISRTLPILGSIVLMVIVLGLLLGWKEPEELAVDDLNGAWSNSELNQTRTRLFAYLQWTSNLTGSLALSLVLFLFPYMAEKLEISPPLHGTMLAIQRLIVILTYSLMYRTRFWQSRISISLVTQVCGIAGLLLLVIGMRVSVLTAGLALLGVMTGYNYFASAFYSTTGFADDRKGMASGIHEATVAVGFGLGALGGGLLGSLWGPRIPYLLCTVAIAASALVQIGILLTFRHRFARHHF